MDKRNRPLTWAPVESCRQKHTSVRDIEGSELGPGGSEQPNKVCHSGAVNGLDNRAQ
jgi:hypothetical protein